MTLGKLLIACLTWIFLQFGVETSSSLSFLEIPPLVPILNELNPFYTMPFVLCEIHFNIVFAHTHNWVALLMFEIRIST